MKIKAGASVLRLFFSPIASVLAPFNNTTKSQIHLNLLSANSYPATSDNRSFASRVCFVWRDCDDMIKSKCVPCIGLSVRKKGDHIENSNG